MSKVEKDKDREYRIDMEVVVDAYDSEERAMGWYYYVSDDCDFPFKARCRHPQLSRSLVCAYLICNLERN